MTLVTAAISITAVLAIPVAMASAEPIQEPGPGQLRYFSILHTDPEGLPEDMAMIFHEPEEVVAGYPTLPLACPGSNPALAQRLPTHLGRLWVIPGRGCLSLAQARGRSGNFPVATNAATTDRVVKHGLAASTIGLVPDGVIATRFSPTLSIPVTNNLYPVPVGDGLGVLWHYPKLIHGATASGG